MVKKIHKRGSKDVERLMFTYEVAEDALTDYGFYLDAKWLEENCFNENLTTFVYFPADSFEVKDSLKDAGFRFSKILLWHIANIPEGYEDKVWV